MRAPAHGDCAVNSEVALTVRPEKIVFADELQRALANTIDAEIVTVIFVGEMYRYEARLGGGQTIVLKRQHRSGVGRCGRGDRVRLAWHVADGRLV